MTAPIGASRPALPHVSARGGRRASRRANQLAIAEISRADGPGSCRQFVAPDYKSSLLASGRRVPRGSRRRAISPRGPALGRCAADFGERRAVGHDRRRLRSVAGRHRGSHGGLHRAGRDGDRQRAEPSRAASRARLVAAADEVRRRIERNGITDRVEAIGGTFAVDSRTAQERPRAEFCRWARRRSLQLAEQVGGTALGPD